MAERDTERAAAAAGERAEVDALYRQMEERARRRDMAARAPEILAVLRQHVPGEHWLEIENYLDTALGRDCLGEAIRRDRARAPHSDWEF